MTQKLKIKANFSIYNVDGKKIDFSEEEIEISLTDGQLENFHSLLSGNFISQVHVISTNMPVLQKSIINERKEALIEHKKNAK